MNEVDPKPRRVRSLRMRNVIPELVFLLVSVDGKRRNTGNKLIVSKSLKPGSRKNRGTEGESQTKTQIRITDFHMVKITCLENKVSDPFRRKFHLVAEQQAVIV